MTLKEKITSLIFGKELTPEEIAENINKVDEYLKNISPDLLKQYKESTGKNEITIFSRDQRDNKGMRHSEKLIAHITEDNKINLLLENWGQYHGGNYTHVNIWDKNLKGINYNEEILQSTQDSRTNISGHKEDILKLEQKLHNKIRNQKIIIPVKNAIKEVFGKVR